MIKGSKISVHRFIATTLFRKVKEWPHSSGNNEWMTIRNSVVAIKRWTEILLPLIIIITAPLRVERSLNLFYSSPRSIYIYTLVYKKVDISEIYINICTFCFFFCFAQRNKRYIYFWNVNLFVNECIYIYM